MGCAAPKNTKSTVPISNSLVHLLQLGDTEAVLKRLQIEGPSVYSAKLNFRGDTIMHYACSKNDIKLVKFLHDSGADFQIVNNSNQVPANFTKNSQILSIIKGNKQPRPMIEKGSLLPTVETTGMSQENGQQIENYEKLGNNCGTEQQQLSKRRNFQRNQSILTAHIKNNMQKKIQSS